MGFIEVALISAQDLFHDLGERGDPRVARPPLERAERDQTVAAADVEERLAVRELGIVEDLVSRLLELG
jgi:hypothetical protein